MHSWSYIGLGIASSVLGFLPFLFGNTDPVLLLLNLIGWSLAASLWLLRLQLHHRVTRIAKTLGLQKDPHSSAEKILRDVLEETERRAASLSLSIVEDKISSSEELARSLERITTYGQKLFQADSVEVALFDQEREIFHSSFVVGRPFSEDPMDTMRALQGASAKEVDGIVAHSLRFAGTTLGLIRVASKKRHLSPESDSLRNLGLLASVSIINSQYTSEILRMKKLSQDTGRVKLDFLATLSHEIRGPLGIILNAVELVIEGLCGDINEEQKETLGMIKGNGSHLLDLVNDVLDFAKAEAGKIVPETATLSADEILKDVTMVAKNQADAKGHKLIYTPASPLLIFNCDKRHIRQMLLNLLTNAIKYTPPKGTIVVWGEQAGEWVRLCVKDTGVGISAENRSKVFSPFERISDSYSSSQVGTGLGMPLTRKLAEANHGNIDFVSEVGKGSIFYIEFPMVSAAAEITSSAPEITSVEGNGDSVIVLEPSEGERALSSRFLSHCGFAVQPVPSLDSLLSQPVSKSTKVILLDSASLGNDGDIQKLRARFGETVKVIVLTSRAFTYDTEAYLKMGVDRCVAKPVPLQNLAAIVRDVIDGVVPRRPVIIREGN